MRMLCRPLRLPFKASSRLPGGTVNSRNVVAAWIASNFRRATRWIVGGSRRESSARNTRSVSAQAKLAIIHDNNNDRRYARQPQRSIGPFRRALGRPRQETRAVTPRCLGWQTCPPADLPLNLAMPGRSGLSRRCSFCQLQRPFFSPLCARPASASAGLLNRRA